MKKLLKIIKKDKRKLITMLNNLLLFKIGAILRSFKKKPLPSGKPVLIHIGCGQFNDSRYINIDTRPGWHIHFVDSIENCEKLFPKNYADLIYVCHVLEHVSHLKIGKTIEGLYKCLKRGGVLRFSVPNFDTIVKIYQEKKSIRDITEPLMGGQGYPANFHCSIFNEDYLKNLLLKSGFKEVRKWNPENAPFHNFNDWSKREIELYDKNWQISLNLEAIK